MGNAKRREYKIRQAFVRETMPLLDVWAAACDLTPLEKEIFRLKRFDENDPNEEEILTILQKKFGYYYTERQLRRDWQRILDKISKIIP